MKYTKLGRSGLKISRLCLGTMNFGWVTDNSDSFKIMDSALESGINIFDTADCYGVSMYIDPFIGNGATEETIGEWFSQGNNRRDKIILSTKVFFPMGAGPNDEGLSAYHIKRSCEDSLRRLKTDHIDIYHMHQIDNDTSWEEIWQAMEQLVREGKITYVSSSNFAAWNIAEGQCRAEARHFMGIISDQSRYNLSARMLELEVIPACKKFGLSLLPWSPLEGGLLAGALKKVDLGRKAIPEVKQEIEKHYEQLKAYESFCDKKGEEPANIGLAWLLHQPIVAAPVIGPRNTGQLKSNLHSLDITLTQEDLDTLDKIWPGPSGKEAPEAYM